MLETSGVSNTSKTGASLLLARENIPSKTEDVPDAFAPFEVVCAQKSWSSVRGVWSVMISSRSRYPATCERYMRAE